MPPQVWVFYLYLVLAAVVAGVSFWVAGSTYPVVSETVLFRCFRYRPGSGGAALDWDRPRACLKPRGGGLEQPPLEKEPPSPPPLAGCGRR